ncbi:MAG TPA: HupE/UreJ family protein [Casimicrobiaceae bacterium]|nr:HupE/UreJ family protein [Casimicrobiaceae bacterium]
MIKHRFPRLRILALLALIIAPAVQAHDALPGAHAFLSGLLHPLTALEHVLPLVALGMLAGQRGLERGQGLLVAFPLAFAIGAIGATWFGLSPTLFAVNASTALVAGGLVAMALALPTMWLYVIVAIIGGIHGLANGLPAAMSIVPFILGATLSAALLFAYAFAGTHYLLRRASQWIPIAVRAVGSWIAAFGVLTLALALPGATAATASLITLFA